MIYNLDIKEHNEQVHIDIEHDIQKQRKGLFTFILRIDNGNVVDYNVVSYVDARDFLVLKKITLTQFTISSHPTNGNQQNPLRTNNGKRAAQGRDSTNREFEHREVPQEKI